MEIVLPKHYAEIKQEEMMYLEGGWSVRKVMKNAAGLAAMKGLSSTGNFIIKVIKENPGIGFWPLVAKAGASAKAAFLLLPTWAKVGTLGIGAATIYAMGTWDLF